MAHLRPLYGAQIGLILSNKVIYALIFSSFGIGRFYGLIFERLALCHLPFFAGELLGYASEWFLFMGGIANSAPSPLGDWWRKRGLHDIVRIFSCTKSG